MSPKSNVPDLNIIGNVWSRGGASFKLTPIQNDLMMLLLSRFGNLVTKEMFYTNIWDNRDSEDPKNLDVQICKIRNRLRNHPRFGLWIYTHWGRGYEMNYLEKDGRALIQGSDPHKFERDSFGNLRA